MAARAPVVRVTTPTGHAYHSSAPHPPGWDPPNQQRSGSPSSSTTSGCSRQPDRPWIGGSSVIAVVEGSAYAGVHGPVRVLVEPIREVQGERGEFDNLPGAGKPLPGLDGTDDPDWWVKG